MNKIVVDGNSIGHANHSGTRLTSGALQVQMIFGMVRAMRAMAVKYPSHRIIVLWDGKSRWREEFFPDYKANRKTDDPKIQADKDAYEKQVPFARTALRLMGIPQLYCTTHEADDLADLIICQTIDKGGSVVLSTGDKDWLQYVRPNVIWFDPIRDRLVNHNTFFEFTGYRTTAAFVQGKALQGDVSDNIKGVGKIGEKGAAELLAQYGSVEEFWKEVDEGRLIPKTKALQHLALPETRDVFYRNMKLVNLREAPKPKPENMVLIKPTYNRDDFKKLCDALAFRSITKDIDGFLEPFSA
ncbi:5'-3' exonuclease H3TH domain-containing protein [Methyloversatilis sp.]|uniref:5'-3' exonuclease H3TH domain-containing protein n=1 Tax=Methyloversatilis sp. TaxID=2569862 RepID=UPI0035B00098